MLGLLSSSDVGLDSIYLQYWILYASQRVYNLNSVVGSLTDLFHIYDNHAKTKIVVNQLHEY